MHSFSTEEQVHSFLLQYSAPTADLLGLDYNAVSEFITADTDLYLLTLLAKAEKQGLDLVFIDKEKLGTALYDEKPIRYLDEPVPWEGAKFAHIDLSFIMYDGHSFTYEGITEPMGLDIDLNTITMIGEAVTFFELEDDMAWLDGNVRTVSDLTAYLNRDLTYLKPSKLKSWWTKMEKTNLVQVVSIVCFIPRLILSLIFNPIRNWLIDLNKPIDFKR